MMLVNIPFAKSVTRITFRKKYWAIHASHYFA